MSLILGSERALFDRHIVQAHLDVDDFEITKETDASGAIQYMDKGTVTVTYKPTEIARHYLDGVFPPPHLKFERALKMNIFNTR